MSNILRLFSDSTLDGGVYNNINVFGSLTVTGDIECQDVDVYGSSYFQGRLNSKSMKIFGKGKFDDEVEITNLSVKGKCKFEKNVFVNNMDIYGVVTCQENIIKSKDVKLYGMLKIKNLEAENIFVKGYVNCLEQLNGENIEIDTNSGSNIKEMVGSKITIKPSRKYFGKAKDIKIDIIEGDDIYLENVYAKVVRGNKIEIGPNCQIDLLEYHESHVIKGNSVVNKIDKY